MYGGDPQQQSVLLSTLLSEALASRLSSPAASAPPPPPSLGHSFGSTPLLDAQSALLLSAAMPVVSQAAAATTYFPTTIGDPIQMATMASAQQSAGIAALIAAQHQQQQQAALLQSLAPDILRLAHETTAVHLNDDPTNLESRSSTASMDLRDGERPLDLSVRKGPSSSFCEQSPSRSSVIRNQAPNRSGGVKRSTSSLSYRPASEATDVSDHFRRSLSGKWPRRPTNYSHFTPNGAASPQQLASPMGGRRSASGSTSRLSQIIISEGQVEDHFRKALGDSNFEQWRRNRDADIRSDVADDEPIAQI